MTTFYLVLFSAVFVAVNALNPFYVKAQRDGPNKKSLALKMTCATGYLVTCLCSMLIAQNFSKFAWLIFGGLVLSWICGSIRFFTRSAFWGFCRRIFCSSRRF